MNAHMGFSRTLSVQLLLRQRIIQRLCEAARLVSADLTGNRDKVRELVDDLAFELDAGDLSMLAAESKGARKASLRFQAD